MKVNHSKVLSIFPSTVSQGNDTEEILLFWIILALAEVWQGHSKLALLSQGYISDLSILDISKSGPVGVLSSEISTALLTS